MRVVRIDYFHAIFARTLNYYFNGGYILFHSTYKPSHYGRHPYRVQNRLHYSVITY